MIRQIHHTSAHQVSAHQASRTAARTAAKISAGTGSFRSVMDNTATSGISGLFGGSSAGNTATTSTSTAGSDIIATITKPAANVVTLSPPTYEQNPTVANPDGSSSPLNYSQFADDATAQQIAVKLGGTVVETTNDGYSATQRSIKVPGSQNLVNAGIAAQLFGMYGDQQGSLAWQIINRDLGRDASST